MDLGYCLFLTKDYKKADKVTIDKINSSHKNIIKQLELNDRVFKTVDREWKYGVRSHKNVVLP